MVNINDLKKAEKLKKENKINCYKKIHTCAPRPPRRRVLKGVDGALLGPLKPYIRFF